MHVPGHNPYLIMGNPNIDISGQYNYLEDLYSYFKLFDGGWGTDYEYSPMQDINMGTYSYQNINPEISSALSNVLQIPAEEIPTDFIENFLSESLGQQYTTVGGDSAVDTANYYEGELADAFEAGGYMTDPIYHNLKLDLGEDYDQGMLPFTNVFDPESLAIALSMGAGVKPDDDLAAIRAGEVKALTPEMIEKTEGQYYEPLEEAKRANLVEQKVKNIGGVSTGGFAGSGGRQSGLSGAERLYQGGYEDLIANIEGMKASATEDVLSTIYGWQELMTGV